MESLQANIIAACPSSFEGLTGQMFAQAVMMVVTAHCALFDDYQWPPDSAQEIIADGPKEFDFIVVGAGTAGSAIAGRLADQYPAWSVLLIEAGDNPSLNSEVPAFLMYNQDIDWKFRTNLDNQSCLAFNERRCSWSKGKALGGSSSMNAMLYVRGHPRDFENWTESGSLDWNYANLSPYFENIEDDFGFRTYKYHANPWYGILKETYQDMGLLHHTIDNNEGIIGTMITKLLTSNGKRLNSAKKFLKGDKNLYIMKNSHVQKVNIDKISITATDVVLKHKSGVVIQIHAKKEIILSAGSVSTPHILMLSGIGPKSHLNEKGVQCIVDLPVGRNLQDHIILPLLFKTNLQIQLKNLDIVSFLLQYMLTKSGPLTNIGLTDFMAFIDTKNKTDYPNIQFHHSYFTKNDNFMLRSYFEGFGYNSDVVNMLIDINRKTDFLGIYPTLLHPKSRGEIRLENSDPKSYPNIKSNYYQDQDDVDTLLQAIKFAIKLQNTATFQSMKIELLNLDLPGCRRYLFKTDEYWECYIRHMGTSIYHPVGTAKMGSKNDRTSVVNPNLQVHGIKNLRVVDASIMPTITGGNTMAPILAIAEKAFEILKKRYSLKEEL